MVKFASTKQRSYPIRISEETYRIVEAMKNEAKKHGRRVSGAAILETAARRLAYRGHENDVTAWTADEERLIRKLLTAMRRERPKSAHRMFVRLVEDILDGRGARGETQHGR